MDQRAHHVGIFKNTMVGLINHCFQEHCLLYFQCHWVWSSRDGYDTIYGQCEVD